MTAPTTPLQSQAHLPTASTVLVSAFRGWLDHQENAGGQPPILVSQLSASGKSQVAAPGFCLEFDPRALHVHLGTGAVTGWTGTPLHPSTLKPMEPGETATHAVGLLSGGPAPAGRFSLFHADLLRRVVMLVSDRFAIAPLCYARDGSVSRFADRAEATLARPRPPIDLQSIYNYLYFHVIPAPRTAYAGVMRLEGAQTVVLSYGAPKLRRTWTPDFSSRILEPKHRRMERLLHVVRQAVEDHCRAGAAGAYLSGGTDSSTIAGFLTRLQGPSTPVFSIGFDAAGYDEMEYARLAARHFGCQHHTYYVTPDDLVAAIPIVASYYDQPFGNSSALPAYYCALLAQQHGVTRLLAGDGGDELFGGNVRYAKQKVLGLYSHLPGSLRAGLLDPLAAKDWAGRAPLLRKVCSYISQANRPMPARMETYNLLDRIGAAQLLTPNFLESIAVDEPHSLQREVYLRQADAGLLNAMLAYDWRFTLSDNDLPKVCGTADLAGTAVSFPLLDDAVVDFSLTLSPSEKVRGLMLRRFFKQALTDFLPREIIQKKKHGFGLPFGPWLLESHALRRLARRSVEQLVDRRLITPDAAHLLFSEKIQEHAGYYGELIWVLMMLEQWLSARAPDFQVD